MLVLKVICLLVMTIAANGQYGPYSQKRIERQSPMSMGMKMLGDLRNGMQRTFDGIMSRVIPRPNPLRHSPHPNRPPPNHHPSASSSHSRVPFGPAMHRPHLQGNIVTKEEFPPAPIFKGATKSSFSVFHEDDLSTRPSVSSDDFKFHHPHPEENEIHGGNHHSNFMFHGNQAQQLNDFNTGSHRNDFVVDDRNAHFKGSPSVEKYAGSTDGWKVIQSPRTPTTFKIKRENYPKSNEIHSNDYRDFENNMYNLPENTIVVTPSPEVESTHYIENHSDLPAVTLKPYISSSYQSNHNGYPGRPRVPPQPQKLINKRPHPQRQPMIANRERSQQIQKREPFQLRHKKPVITQRGNARLVSNGYKMEMGPKQNEEERTVNGYEFGYGVVDDSNGNTFYHAEKKKDGTTQGSYKVNLPDGRVQTVNYLANEHGYQPDISFEGKSEFPTPDQ